LRRYRQQPLRLAHGDRDRRARSLGGGVSPAGRPEPPSEALSEARGSGGARRLPLPAGGARDRGPGHHDRHGLAMVRAAGVKAGKSRRGGAASGPALAFWLEYPSLPACEIAALCGYDAVIFDHEHGVMPQADADRLTLACKRLGLTVYSRVASAERVAVQHALDAGVDGVILPQIADLAHARAVTALAKYPPLGSRGVGYSRAMGYDGVAPDFFERENCR